MAESVPMRSWTILIVGMSFLVPYFCKSPLMSISSSIALVPSFAGLQRFPQGCHFQQWTGDDSKSLMKVCEVSASWCLGLMSIGLYFCDWRSCPSRNDPLLSCSPQLLLHFSTEFPHPSIYAASWSGFIRFHALLRNFLYNWCSSWWIWSSLTTFCKALPHQYSAVWGT